MTEVYVQLIIATIRSFKLIRGNLSIVVELASQSWDCRFKSRLCKERLNNWKIFWCKFINCGDPCRKKLTKKKNVWLNRKKVKNCFYKKKVVCTTPIQKKEKEYGCSVLRIYKNGITCFLPLLKQDCIFFECWLSHFCKNSFQRIWKSDICFHSFSWWGLNRLLNLNIKFSNLSLRTALLQKVSKKERSRMVCGKSD